MKKNVCIIGAGIFGTTIYIVLKKYFNCIILEKSSKILSGASSNNLNRVHLGYHYPRDDETAKQSYKGINSFLKLYGAAVLKNFNNYYLIAKNGKVNFSNFIKFMKKNNLKFRLINKDKFPVKVNNIEGIIKVKEPIYDWYKIEKVISSKLNFKDVFLNSEVTKINKVNNRYVICSNKKKFYSDIIIDATHYSTNRILNKDDKYLKKFNYQFTCVYQVFLKDFKKIGIAIMDGDFFSLLPKGFSDHKHLFYDVKYSILRSKIAKKIPKSWNIDLITKKKIKSNISKINKKIKIYLPLIKLKFENKYYTSNRVIMTRQKKTDKRISKLIKLDKNYYQVFSAKVDHSVDMAKNIRDILLK